MFSVWVQIRRYLVALAAISIYSVSLAEGTTATSVDLYFDLGSEAIIEDRNLEELNAVVDSSLGRITHIAIVGYSSPDGSTSLNHSLSNLRAETVKEYLVEVKSLPDSIITTHAAGVAWQRLQAALEGRELRYEYIVDRIYPQLRYANVTINREHAQPIEVVIPYLEEVEPISKSVAAPRPLFAIKTNLLFDVASLINVEVEIPIKDRWSIAAEYIFPWWVMDSGRASSRRNRLQLLNGNLEGRYWWGDRSSRPILTGWFTGLYMGVGSYDFEYHAKGYQGEFFVAAGVSGGYSHTINRAKNLRMEYSLGVGYLATDYQYYYGEYCVNERWHAIEQRSGRYSWIGPMRAKVSLSWLINIKGGE